MSIFIKAKKAVKNPKLAFRIVYDMAWKWVKELSRKKYQWTDEEIKRKMYRTYEEYVSHQQLKLKKIGRQEYNKQYRIVLRDRLDKSIVQGGKTVLCLAARLGGEVQAFKDLGCFAVGIDLNAGKENRYVLFGDFHDIQFADHSVDIVFTNSLDHSLDLPRLIGEIKRVLKRGGWCITELNYGTEEGYTPGYFEATAWKRIDDIIELLSQKGFKYLGQKDFEYPWHGQQVTFQLL